MYHLQICSSLGELATELDRPIEPSELDERGCVDKGVLTQIDAKLKAWMEPRVTDFALPPDLMKGTDPKNKWRVISCLQKAIRFGDVVMAAHMANVSMDLDPDYTIKRMGVIAVEDVGYGNLMLTMATLAAIGDTKWRQKVGPRKLMVWLAVELAAGLKDRSAVEAQVAVSLWENAVTMDMGHWPNEKLIEIIDDEAQDWRWRHAAIMNLAGTKRYGGPGLSESNDRPATYLFQQMVKNGMSLAGYYVAAKTCSRLQDSMWPSLYIMDEWARHAGSVEVIPTTVPSEQVGKLLGAAYDRHVREGKVAIAKAFRESPKLQQFLIASPETRREQMRLSGVFMAEGGTLDRRLAYGGSEWVRSRVRTCSERYHWLPPGLRGTYVDAIREELPFLNECRSKVLFAVLKS